MIDERSNTTTPHCRGVHRHVVKIVSKPCCDNRIRDTERSARKEPPIIYEANPMRQQSCTSQRETPLNTGSRSELAPNQATGNTAALSTRAALPRAIDARGQGHDVVTRNQSQDAIGFQPEHLAALITGAVVIRVFPWLAAKEFLQPHFTRPSFFGIRTASAKRAVHLSSTSQLLS